MLRAKVKFTYGDYLQLPEDKRYELMEGEFYMVPSLNVYHQTILEKIFLALHQCLLMCQIKGKMIFTFFSHFITWIQGIKSRGEHFRPHLSYELYCFQLEWLKGCKL